MRIKAQRKIPSSGVVNINYIESDEQLLKVEEVAKRLDATVNSVYALIQSGKLKAMKLPTYRVRVKTLNNFIAENEGEDLTEVIRAYLQK